VQAMKPITRRSILVGVTLALSVGVVTARADEPVIVDRVHFEASIVYKDGRVAEKHHAALSLD
jgi:hypothetical protein